MNNHYEAEDHNVSKYEKACVFSNNETFKMSSNLSELIVQFL